MSRVVVPEPLRMEREHLLTLSFQRWLESSTPIKSDIWKDWILALAGMTTGAIWEMHGVCKSPFGEVLGA